MPFVGNEAAFTFLDEQPHGATMMGPFGGVMPIGNVHPNELGYADIGAQVAAVNAVPEPATWAFWAGGMLLLTGWRTRLAVRRS